MGYLPSLVHLFSHCFVCEAKSYSQFHSTWSNAWSQNHNSSNLTFVMRASLIGQQCKGGKKGKRGANWSIWEKSRYFSSLILFPIYLHSSSSPGVSNVTFQQFFFSALYFSINISISFFSEAIVVLPLYEILWLFFFIFFLFRFVFGLLWGFFCLFVFGLFLVCVYVDAQFKQLILYLREFFDSSIPFWSSIEWASSKHS